MEYGTDESEGRGERWHVPVAALVTFLFTFVSTFLLLNPSVLYRPEVTAADDVGTIEDGFCRLAADAPDPSLRCGSPVKLYEELRRDVIAAAGFDSLARRGDMKRHEKAEYSERGVANDSKHKSGLAFDYDQEDARVLIVREAAAGLTYWRTRLRCERRDGTCGVEAEMDADDAGRVSAYSFDFTAAAESLGWERIPAQEGWQYGWKKKEFWRYPLKASLSAGSGATAAAEQDHDRQERASQERKRRRR